MSDLISDPYRTTFGSPTLKSPSAVKISRVNLERQLDYLCLLKSNNISIHTETFTVTVFYCLLGEFNAVVLQ